MGAAMRLIGKRIERALKRAKQRAARRRKTEAQRRALYMLRLSRP